MAASKRALTKVECNGITARVYKDGDTGADIEVELGNGTSLRLGLSNSGALVLDHSLSDGKDERRILTGHLTEKKRSFDVYSTSGYVNHYKGKPLDPSLAPVVDTPATDSSSTSAAAEEPTGDAATATAPPTSGESITAPAEHFIGMSVKRSDGDTGTVTGFGKDVVGTHLNIEWANKGFESMYADDLKAAGVETVPTPEPEAKKSSGSPKAKGSTKRSSSSRGKSASSKKPAKKPASAAHHYDGLDELVADLTAGA